ncbi:MAG: S8 family peptidase [Candidatus Symbiothrix sp.]|jgi:subtilisin family serine protease|nr:S8 family peptidase [Candidatus Symbiothrix sp.]
MKNITVIGLWMLASLLASAQQAAMYRIQLHDKGESSFSLSAPEDFLSEKAIQRRARQGYAVDSTDLPIATAYMDSLTAAGANVRACSKWVKTVLADIPDATVLAQVAALPFVDTLIKVRPERPQAAPPSTLRKFSENLDFNPTDYGNAWHQLELNNAHLLHEAGFKGNGITIAVVDAGFLNIDLLTDFLNPAQILGTKNFTHETGDFYRINQSHGTMVLSCILANKAGQMIGTAPEAEVYLLKSEVNGEEYPVEEDYWVAALEYADSIGVDIVTTSLGYTTFDDASMNHTWDDLDGATVPASRAATMAANKGLLLCNAAGNEGSNAWRKISVPADADNLLTVGGIAGDSTLAYFSSHGYTADHRVKPDVVAMGALPYVLNASGSVGASNGTSFATPIMAGMVACLWSALPDLTALELMQAVRQSADRYAQPDSLFGFGIPNIYQVYEQLSPPTAIALPMKPDLDGACYDVFSIDGRLLRKQVDKSVVRSLPAGVYILRHYSDNQQYARKIMIL